VDAWGWLGKSERFQAGVNESRPLFGDWAFGTRARATGFLTHFIWVAPLAFGWLAWRDRARPASLAFAAWGLLLLGLTLLQWRFMNSYVLPHAIVMSAVGVQVWDVMRRRQGLYANAAVVLALVVAFSILSGAVGIYGSHLRVLTDRESVPVTVLRRDAQLAAARWLATHAASRSEPAAVMGAWGDGHLIKYGSQLAVVQDNFGDDVAPENFELAAQYFADSDEDAAVEMLDKLGVRYVWARSTGAGQTAPFKAQSLRTRLWRLDGARSRVGTGGRIVVPALQRHRMLYETDEWQRVSGVRRPLLLLYEVVEGARVAGKMMPGTVLRFDLDLVSNTGRQFVYRVEARADADGRYSLRLPYATGETQGAVVSGDVYQVFDGERSATMRVTPGAVEEGNEIAPPFFVDPESEGRRAS
jgi:hypothetical protein